VEVSLRTLGTLVLAYQDQGGGPGPSDAAPHSIVQLLLDSGSVEKTVLVILLLFSALSWAVVFYKQQQLRKASKQTADFLEVFRKSNRFSEVQAVCANLSASPLVGLFLSGYSELNAQLRTAGDKPAPGATRPTL
jgi:biopolymer transport protein TolQ